MATSSPFGSISNTTFTTGLGSPAPATPSLVGSNQASSMSSPTGIAPASLLDNLPQQSYNGLIHKVQLYLDNSGNPGGTDTTTQFPINPAAVLDMSFTNTITDWIVEGYLTFMYLPEDSDYMKTKLLGQPQSTATAGVGQAAINNGDMLKSYQFRGDGFDVLRVLIAPIAQNATNNPNALVISENDTNWYLSYLFSVYDIEDVNTIPELDGHPASYMKCLKLYFRDIRHQILKTTNLEYSTANSPEATFEPAYDSVDPIHKTGGVLKTGKAILEILKQTVGNGQNGGNPDMMPLFDDHWDIGAGSLFYTSPAESTAMDDVEYLMDSHVSIKQLKGTVNGGNDLCLLHTRRARTVGLVDELAISPVSDFFDKAGSEAEGPGELQKEHFFVTALTDEGPPSVLKNFRAPVSDSNPDRDLKTAKYGQIISFSFVDMSAEANSALFITAPVYSVDIGKRTFNIEFQNNDVKTARAAIAQTYIKPLYKKGDGDQLFLPTIHKTKKSVNVFPKFTLNGDNKIIRQKKGILDLIYTGLFQNACICFKTLGLTMREPGTFIGIDKTEGCAEGDYNDKLYGQWFVVKVDHLFEAGIYMNYIWAIKIHRFQKPQLTFKDTIDTI